MGARVLLRRWSASASAAAAPAAPAAATAAARTGAEVRRQTAATSLFLSRHTLEHLTGSRGPVSLSKEQAGRVNASVRAVDECLKIDGLGDALSPQQRRLLRLPLGAWTPADVDSYFPHWESLARARDAPPAAALLWALRAVEDMPPWHANADITAVYKATKIQPAVPSTVVDFVAGPHELQPLADLRLERDRAEAWHWRARAQRLVFLEEERKRGPAVLAAAHAIGRGWQRGAPLTPVACGAAFRATGWVGLGRGQRPVPPAVARLAKNAHQAIEQATQRALADSLLPYAVNDDFPVTSPTGEAAAYAELTPADVDALERIAAGRLHALGWILGTYTWDTPLDELGYASPTSALWAPVDAS